MSTVIRVPDKLAQLARARGKAEQRSMTSQIEHWATLGRIAEEKPDLPCSFIKGTLVGMAEIEAGLGEPFKFSR
ncbi:MAG: TA system antitoxin ParD family protein [Verrucomicrobiota bacterium]